MESLLLTVEQAAKVIGIGRSKLYELLEKGHIESVRIGRARRVPVSSLEGYVNRILEDAVTLGADKPDN